MSLEAKSAQLKTCFLLLHQKNEMGGSCSAAEWHKGKTAVIFVFKTLHKNTTTGQKWQQLDVALYMVHNEHMRLRQQTRPSLFTGITALRLYVSVRKTGFSRRACLCKTEPGTPSGQQSRSVPWPLTYGHQNLISVSFVSNLEKFPLGVLDMFHSQEWDVWRDRQPTNII